MDTRATNAGTQSLLVSALICSTQGITRREVVGDAPGCRQAKKCISVSNYGSNGGANVQESTWLLN